MTDEDREPLPEDRIWNIADLGTREDELLADIAISMRKVLAQSALSLAEEGEEPTIQVDMSPLKQELGEIKQKLDNIQINPQNLQVTTLSLSSLPIGAKKLEQVESDSPVTINENTTGQIIRYTPDKYALWTAVGTTDNNNSEYFHVVDGDNLFQKQLNAPLATPDDLHNFSNPLLVEDEMRVVVKRTGGGSADYISRIRMIQLNEEEYQILKERGLTAGV